MLVRLLVCPRAPPGPAGRAYSAASDPLAAFDSPPSKKGRGGMVWGGDGREDATHPYEKILATPLTKPWLYGPDSCSSIM